MGKGRGEGRLHPPISPLVTPLNKKEYYVVHIIELFLDQKKLKQVGNSDKIPEGSTPA